MKLIFAMTNPNFLLIKQWKSYINHIGQQKASRNNKKIYRKLYCFCVFGAYENDKFVGMARVITVFATTFYIADVIVDGKYRGKGMGKKNCFYNNF